MKELFKEVVTPDMLRKILFAIAGIIVCCIVYFVIKKLFKRFIKNKLKPHVSAIVEKIVQYSFYVLITIYILSIFGIKLTALFGAAGIAGVAIGFAAQTSFSNIISGFFLLSEHAFKIGDYISIDDQSGIVDSIDMLSVKIHTLDNQMIRIPNETIIKSNMMNNSFFSLRRMTIPVLLPYEANLEKALKILGEIPSKCSFVVKNPAPSVWCDGFDTSGVKAVIAVWFNSKDFVDTKNNMYILVSETLKKENLDLPYTQIVVHNAKA